MNDLKHYFRHYFLSLQDITNVESLQNFYLEKYNLYRLTEGNLKINGEKIPPDIIKELIAKSEIQKSYRDAPVILSAKDILEVDEIPFSEQSFIKATLLTLNKADDTVLGEKIDSKSMAYRGYIEVRLKELKNGPVKLSHREHALIYKYKADAKYITPNKSPPSAIEKEFGPKRKQAFYTIWTKGKAPYRPSTPEELTNIIPQLVQYPDAQKAAINDLEEIKRRL